MQATLLGAALLLGVACEDAPCTPDQCDIRQVDCQRSIMEATACLSGVDPVEVEVEVISQGDYRQLLEESVAEQQEDEHTLAAQRALALLKLAPADDTPRAIALVRADETAASYWGTENRVYIIDRGMPLDSKNSVALLVHELTHALQFSTPGRLPEDVPPTFDAQLAFAASIEGEATWNGDRALALLVEGSTSDVDWRRLYDDWTRATWRSYYHEERRVTRARSYFAYSYGARYIVDQPLNGTSLPTAHSSREIMYDGLPAPNDRLGQVPRIEGERLTVDTLGNFVVWGWLVARMRDSGLPTSPFPPLVAADTLTLLRDAQGKVGAIWHIEFDAPVAELVAALAELEADDSRLGDIGHVATTRVDASTMVVFAAEDEETVRGWVESPPGFEELEIAATKTNTDPDTQRFNCHQRHERNETPWDLPSPR